MYRVHRGIMASGDGLYAAVRSLGSAAWFQPGVGVTGTLTASAWADQSGNGRDLAQGTAGNQPIYLSYSGTPYAWLPKVAGNTMSTPASAANQITGDLDVRVRVALDDWTPAAQAALLGRFYTGNARSYEFRVETDGKLSLGWTPGADAAIITATSSVASGITDAAVKWVRATLDVDNGASGYTVTFYTSDDGSTWSTLGTAVTAAGVTSIAAGNDILYVGARASGSVDALGKFYRAQIYNGIDGTLAVDFDPSTFSETSTNGATATASTGEVWTLNSTGAKPAQVVKSASLLGDGTASFMTASVPLAVSTIYIVGKQITWTLNDTILGGNVNGINIFQSATTPALRLFAGAAAAENANLALGGYGVVTAVFNGASSLLQINATTATTGNAGTPNETIITLFAGGGGGSAWANWQVKEFIAFPAAHTAAERSVVRNYLAVQHRIAL